MIKTKEKTIEWLKGFDELLGSGEHNNHDGIRSAIYHLENSIPMDAEVKVNFAELESIQYLNKMRELINLGDGININARLLILRRKIIDDVESLSKSKISA